MSVAIRPGLAIAALAIIVSLAGNARAQDDSTKAKAAEHFQQGEAYWKVKAYDKAIGEYEAAYALVPKAGFLFNIGLCHEALEDKAKALDHYKRYLAEAPKGAKATEARARATQLERDLADQERAAGEEKARAEAAAKKKSEIDALVAAGDADAANDRFDDAVEAYQAAHGLSGDAEMLYRIGTTYEAKGDAGEAMVHYESYLAQAPGGTNSVEARRRLQALRDEAAAAAAAKAAQVPVVAGPKERKPRRFRFGLKAGLNSTKVGFFAEDQGTVCNNPSFVIGGLLGVVGTYAVSEHFGVQGEVLYFGKALNTVCDGLGEFGIDTYYLEVPLLFRLTKSDGGGALYAGGLIAAPVSFDDPNNASLMFENPGLALGFALGFEGAFSVGSGQVTADLRLEGTDAKYHAEGTMDYDVETEMSVSFTLGYRFR